LIIYRKGQLVSNVLAAQLATELGLASAYKVDTYARAHLWEAYLAALCLETGRRGLLEFLAPIVKSSMQELYSTDKARSTEVMQMISQGETETIRIFKLPKMGELLLRISSVLPLRLCTYIDPITFSSLEYAKANFRSTLEARKIPYLLRFSPSEHSATLQLPGFPLIASQPGAKATNKRESLLSGLTKEAIAKGCFKILP